MLKIRILGNGLIPRGLGLAPRLEPFPADFMLVYTILSTSKLEVQFINPNTNRFEPVTLKNLKKIWDSYGVMDTPKNVPVEESKVQEEPVAHEPVLNILNTERYIVTPEGNEIPIVPENRDMKASNEVENVSESEEVIEGKEIDEVADVAGENNSEDNGIVPLKSNNNNQNNKYYNNGKNNHHNNKK